MRFEINRNKEYQYHPHTPEEQAAIEAEKKEPMQEQRITALEEKLQATNLLGTVQFLRTPVYRVPPVLSGR